MIRLTGLHLYPIKSTRGLAVTSWPVDSFGLGRDRRYMVVDAAGRFITQRRRPEMTHIQAKLTDVGLTLQAPDLPDLAVTHPAGETTGPVEIWGEAVPGHDAGDMAADWLSTWLGEPCRLVYMANETHRGVDTDFAPDSARVSFADGFSFLLISEESLADLNERLDTPVPMARFRPNLVVTGEGAFAEDTWRKIRIGPITFDVVKPCARCSMTTVDPLTGRKGKEPLRTLATFRKRDGEVMFGQNLVHYGTGPLSVGDAVEVLERL